VTNSTTLFPLRPAVFAALAVLSAGCSQESSMPTDTPAPAPPAALDWPALQSAIAADPQIETRVAEMLGRMTLRQKIGQMIQAEIKSITPDEVRTHYIGSVLNGGGSWPARNKQASVGDWLTLADAYYTASMSTDAADPIPIIWGTDAVHGHSNVVGATLFPHNIGLGAAHDLALIERIGAATAQSVRATGIQWVFAPTVAAAQSPRWGRTYESFAVDGALIRDYAAAYVRGMQGGLREDGKVIATAKHFIGDGATELGRDQGVAQISKAEMITTHAQGYFGAIEAGVQTVMASYNSWTDPAAAIEYGKMHGAKALLTDALKNAMGFDGFIVSDWNAVGQLPGCSNRQCAAAINAGIDMIMVPDDWKAFIENTLKQVESGEITQARIDDAVTRILRVKLRAGLFEQKPSDSAFAGKPDALVHRELARQAVRQSLVLLKNEAATLPLKRDQRVLVVGEAADSVPHQSGGWSITWQGTDTSNVDFPNADTLLSGVREQVGAERVSYSADGSAIASSDADVIVAVIGEAPYAETNGDILSSFTLAHSQRDPADLALLQAAQASGRPVVTVFLSGRPLYVNDLLNLSHAFVAAWLPGTEGKGISDVLFGSSPDGTAFDFTGRLSFPWPGNACPERKDSTSLFEVGQGQSYASPSTAAPLPVDIPDACGPATALPIFNMADAAPFALEMRHQEQSRALGADLNAVIEWPAESPALRVATVQMNTQQDAKDVTWLAPASLVASAGSGSNLNALAHAQAALSFDIRIEQAATAPVHFEMRCGERCGVALDLSALLQRFGVGEQHTVKLPLACFAQHGVDMGGVNQPFGLIAEPPFRASVTRIRIVASAGSDSDAINCADLPLIRSLRQP
jgi:beta-glucosidase